MPPEFKQIDQFHLAWKLTGPEIYAVGAAGYWLSRFFRQAEIPVSPECDNALDVWEQPL